MKLFKISVNISVRIGGSPYLVLESLKKIEYPPNLFEIIIIGGDNLTKQRNRGAKVSKGEIIYLLDNDSQPDPNALKIISKEFLNPKVAAVGGPSLTPIREKKYLSLVIGYILGTYFGAFRMKYRYSQQKNVEGTEYKLIGSNLSLRKSALLRVGGFDEKFQANDETELLRRLQGKGYNLKYSPKLVIYRDQRKKLNDLIKQFHHYGKGRMKQILKNPKWEDFFLLAPIFFVIYLLSLIIYHPFLYLIPLIIYIVIGILTSLKAAIKYKKLDLLISMTLLYPLIHFSYALGLLEEFILKETEPLNKSTKSLRVKFIKTFSD